nr:MAG: hypothetical protein DIU70_08635 [Bacillota bacterium]
MGCTSCLSSATARGSLLHQFRSAAVVLTEQRMLFFLMLFGAITAGVSFILKQSCSPPSRSSGRSC